MLFKMFRIIVYTVSGFVDIFVWAAEWARAARAGRSVTRTPRSGTTRKRSTMRTNITPFPKRSVSHPVTYILRLEKHYTDYIIIIH